MEYFETVNIDTQIIKTKKGICIVKYCKNKQLSEKYRCKKHQSERLKHESYIKERYLK